MILTEKEKNENPPNISADQKMSDNMKMLRNKNYKLSPPFFKRLPFTCQD